MLYLGKDKIKQKVSDTWEDEYYLYFNNYSIVADEYARSGKTMATTAGNNYVQVN